MAATVRALVSAQASIRPDDLYALRADGVGETLSFGQLARDCQVVSGSLRSQGSVPGDVISLVMPNGLLTLRILIGAMVGGWCVNPVNLLAQEEQIKYVLKHSDCKLVFVSPDREAMVRHLLTMVGRDVALVVADPDGDAIPTSGQDHWAVPDEDGPSARHAGVSDSPTADAMALLMYTSGTTGVPKGVMLTQSNLCANARTISHEHALTSVDRVLAVLPLYHINAFVVTMLAPLAHGGSLVMPSRFSAGRFWAQARDYGCTWLNVVPTMVSYLLQGDDAAAGIAASIRFCRSASAALPPEHLRAFERRFGIGIVETMGLTETTAPAFSNPMDPRRRKIGAVGVASGCEAAVMDAALRPVADGVTGELAIRGPNVMRGYYKDDQATQASFTPDGWLRSGDLGHRDTDGFFFVTGRIKELIIKGGENIAPREIDEVLLRHPDVLDAAAVGIPDEHYGQDIFACVVLRPGASCGAQMLRAFCEQHLGRFKTPREFRFVDDLPRGPSGKVQRLKLLNLV